MTEEPLDINCDKHGKGIAAVVCRHLIRNTGQPLGFIENSRVKNDFQAWCFACEYVYEIEGEMTPKFREFCSFSMVCEQCYELRKEHHTVDI